MSDTYKGSQSIHASILPRISKKYERFKFEPDPHNILGGDCFIDTIDDEKHYLKIKKQYHGNE